TKIIMISVKAFAVEKDRALRYGADLFLEKPYEIRSFREKVIAVVGQPTKAKQAGIIPASKRGLMRVRIWGARSQPEPPAKLADGLHTPCISVETDDYFFIFDAGSGLLPLGEELLRATDRKELWLFLTHSHAAHIEGLGLFGPTRSSQMRLHIG